VCKKSKDFAHGENRVNGDYKARGSFPCLTIISVDSVFSVFIFLAATRPRWEKSLKKYFTIFKISQVILPEAGREKLPPLFLLE